MIIINYGGFTENDAMGFIEIATDADIDAIFAEDNNEASN